MTKQCKNCGWEGEKPQEIWAGNPTNPQDEILKIEYACPVCGSPDIENKIEIIKDEL